MQAALTIAFFALVNSADALDGRWTKLLKLPKITEIVARPGLNNDIELAVDYGNGQTTTFGGFSSINLDGVVLPEGLERFRLGGVGLKELPRGFKFPSTVNFIELNDNALVTIPSSVKWPAKLTSLDLSRNKIGSIDKAVVWPPSLTALDLSTNKVTSFPATKWPAALESLMLYSNPLKTIPANAAWPPALTALSLADTQLTTLPTNLPSTLQSLNLADNALGGAFPTRTQLPDSIQSLVLSNTGLTKLPATLDWPRLTQFTATKNSVTKLPRQFSKSLVALDLSYNKLDAIDANTTLPSDSLNVAFNQVKSVQSVALPKFVVFTANPIAAISRVTFSEGLFWSYMDSPALQEFTLSAAMADTFQWSLGHFFVPQFSSNASAVQAKCDLEEGKVTSLTATLTVCVVSQ